MVLEENSIETLGKEVGTSGGDAPCKNLAAAVCYTFLNEECLVISELSISFMRLQQFTNQYNSFNQSIEPIIYSIKQ